MTLTTIVSTRRIPQLGEIAILTQRKLTLLNILEIYGRAMSDDAAQQVYEELAEIETAIQHYDGTMYDMALEGYETPMQVRASLDL